MLWVDKWTYIVLLEIGNTFTVFKNGDEIGDDLYMFQQ